MSPVALITEATIQSPRHERDQMIDVFTDDLQEVRTLAKSAFQTRIAPATLYRWIRQGQRLPARSDQDRPKMVHDPGPLPGVC